MRRGRPPHPDFLTPRVWQVLALIREGLTNEEIARRLGISIRGARYHVGEILSKLGVSSREEAASIISTRERRFAALPLLSFLRIGPAARSMALLLGGAVAVTAVLTLVLLRPSGDTGLDASPAASTDAIGLDLPANEPAGAAAAFVGVAMQVAQVVAETYPDAALKQVVLPGSGDWAEFTFLTAAATCVRDLPAPTDPAIGAFYADKCDVFITVPRDAATVADWRWQARDPRRGDIGAPGIDLAAVQVGPTAVERAATDTWPDCQPSSFNLSATHGPLTWTVFCAQADGGMLSGSVDATTGEFTPLSPGPLQPPPTAVPLS